MAEETQEINWCRVIQDCVYERSDGIGDYFCWLKLNPDLVNARGCRQEQAAFTRAEAVVMVPGCSISSGIANK